MRFTVRRILPLLLLLTTACTTTMTVTKVTPANRGTVAGTRYYLPKPLLMVTPQADGTAKFEWVYVQDSTAQYAIDTKSYVSKLKTTIELDGSSFLTKVAWNGAATELSAAALGNTANVMKAKIEAEAAADKAAKDAAAAAKKAREDAIAAARAKVREAEVALALAEAENAERPENDPKKLDARAAEARARAALVEAQRTLDALLAEDAASSGGARGAASTDKDQKNETGRPKAWGPVFFEIEFKDGYVELKEVAPQKQIETWKKPEKATPPATPVFRFKHTAVAAKSKDGSRYELRIVTSVPIHSLSDPSLLLKGEDGEEVVPEPFVLKPTIVGSGSNEILVALKPNLVAGTYRLSLIYKATEKSEDATLDPPLLLAVPK